MARRLAAAQVVAPDLQRLGGVSDRRKVGTDGEPLRFEFTVPAHPMSLGFVRRAMYTLGDVCGPEVAETLALVFSELMTNAIRHSGAPENDPLEVLLEIGGPRVRGSVTDRGSGFEPRAVRSRPGEEGGYGLRIVDRIATKWGADHLDARTTVWFEL
jgi:signal transduction histidine kinase